MKKVILFIFIASVLQLMPNNASAQFIQNNGQVLDLNENFKPEVLYYYGINGNAMYFEQNRIVCVFSKFEEFDFSIYEGNQEAKDSIYKTLGTHTQRVDIEFVNANLSAVMSSGEELPFYTNFNLNKRENIQGVKSFKSITYHNIWNHIDLIFYVSDKGIKYDVVLHEGANINDVKIKYNGASSISLSENTLLIQTKYRDLTEDIPLAFINDDMNQSVQVEYVVDGNIIGFKTQEKDYQKLTIDPVLVWATYFETATSGGTLDYDHNVADVDGNLFIYGVAWNAANNYPVVNPGGGAYIMNHVSNNGYLAKFNANRTLVWATYFGGSTDIDWSLGTNVMAIGGTTLHIVGDQLSSDAPKPNGGGFHYTIASTRPFWVRFNKDTGAMLHCTNIGGHTSSYPSIAISSTGLVSIIMSTYDFAVVHVVNRAGAFNQALNGGFQDIFLYLFNSTFNQIWGTWLGGPGTQESAHVTFDSNNNIFFVVESQWMSGSTIANERLVNPGGGAYYQSTNFGVDLMIGKFTSAGVLYWNTLYGGGSRDGTRGNFGNGSRVYTHPTTNELLVTAGTMSTNLPLQVLTGAYNITCPSYITGGGGMCSEIGSFILKFSNNGARQWATYWGEGTGGCNLLYNAHYTDCDKLILGARSSSPSISHPGYYNQATGQQAYLMQLNSTTYAAEWASKIGINTGVPKIAYTPYQTRLYLSSVTSSQLETTLNPGGGAFYDGSFTGPHWGSYYITEFNIIPPPVLGDTTICAGSSVVLTVTGGVGSNYSWYTSSSGGTAFHTGSSYTTPVLNNTTTYYVSSSDGTCISDRTPVTVTVVAAPSISISPASTTICNGNSTNLTVSGATSYSWSHGLGSGTTQNVSPSSTTTYTVTGTMGSCAGTASVTVTVIANPIVTITPAAASICAGQSVLLTASGASSYDWSGLGAGSTQTVSPSSTTTYTVTGTTSVCTGSTQVTVTVSAAFNATITPVSAVCANATPFNFSAVDGGGTWSGTGITNSTNGTFNPTTAGPGTHTITYTISGPCGDVGTTQITVHPQPSVTLNATSTSICNGESVTLNAGGAPNYTWSPSGSGNTHTTSPSSTTTWTVTGTDANNCSNTAQVTVNVSAAFNATITPVSAICVDALPFNFSAVDGGGTWSGTGILNSSTGLFNPTTAGAGTHTITYAIGGSCGDTATTQITVHALPNILAIASPQNACIGEDVTLTASGGTGYDWGGFGTGSPITVTPSSTTTYTVTGTDANSCSNTAQVTVTVVSNYDASISAAGPFCTASGNATLTAADAGGTWSGSGITNATNGTFDPSVAGAGTHTITYGIPGACGDTATISITVNESPDMNATSTNESCTGNSDGEIVVTVSGGTTPYSYSWTPSGSGTSSNGLSEGAYTIITTDANGCQRSITVTLEDPNIPCDAYQPHVVVPTVFSPNGDGQNDILYVRGEGVVSIEFIVFTRWGEKVFETTDMNIGWDGTHKGKVMDPAVFVYSLRATLINGDEVNTHGDVTLLR
jgi:gliding motility-associated-like protein